MHQFVWVRLLLLMKFHSMYEEREELRNSRIVEGRRESLTVFQSSYLFSLALLLPFVHSNMNDLHTWVPPTVEWERTDVPMLTVLKIITWTRKDKYYNEFYWISIPSEIDNASKKMVSKNERKTAYNFSWQMGPLNCMTVLHNSSGMKTLSLASKSLHDLTPISLSNLTATFAFLNITSCLEHFSQHFKLFQVSWTDLLFLLPRMHLHGWMKICSIVQDLLKHLKSFL